MHGWFTAAARTGVRTATIALLVPLAAAAQPSVYVANLGSDDVSVIDAATNQVVATLPAGDDPDDQETDRTRHLDRHLHQGAPAAIGAGARPHRRHGCGRTLERGHPERPGELSLPSQSRRGGAPPRNGRVGGRARLRRARDRAPPRRPRSRADRSRNPRRSRSACRPASSCPCSRRATDRRRTRLPAWRR